MTPTQSLLNEIEAYLSKADMAESTFGRKTVNDGKLLSRLRAGGSVSLDTAAKLRAFMETARDAAK